MGVVKYCSLRWKGRRDWVVELMRDDILGHNSQTIIPTHNSQTISERASERKVIERKRR